MKKFIILLLLGFLTACGKPGDGSGGVNSPINPLDQSIVGAWTLENTTCPAGAVKSFTINSDGKVDVPQNEGGSCVLTSHFKYSTSGNILIYTFVNSTVENCGSSITPTDVSSVIWQLPYTVQGNALNISLTGCEATFSK